MLGKLFKHEFKQTGRYFLPLYIAMPILFAIIGIIFRNRIENDIIIGLSVLAIFGVTIALLVVSIYVNVKRFAQGVYGNEGYLTNTLPVKASEIVASKTLVMVAYFFITAIIEIASFAILAYLSINQKEWARILSEVDFDTMFDFLNSLIRSRSYAIPVLIISTIITPFASTLQYFLAVAIAHLRYFNKHKVISGLGSYIILNLLISAISFAVTDTAAIDNIQEPSMVTKEFVMEMCGKFIDINIPSIIISLAICILFFLATSYLIKNKLELE